MFVLNKTCETVQCGTLPTLHQSSASELHCFSTFGVVPPLEGMALHITNAHKAPRSVFGCKRSIQVNLNRLIFYKRLAYYNMPVLYRGKKALNRNKTTDLELFMQDLKRIKRIASTMAGFEIAY